MSCQGAETDERKSFSIRKMVAIGWMVAPFTEQFELVKGKKAV